MHCRTAGSRLNNGPLSIRPCQAGEKNVNKYAMFLAGFGFLKTQIADARALTVVGNSIRQN